MYITLNIGLDVSKHYLPEGAAEMKLAYDHVVERLEKTIGKPTYIGLARSATDDTVVVKYANVERTLFRLFDLAADLKQDCIAYSVQADNGSVLGGSLVGEYAHEWNYGLFNPAYFIEVL